ncbi:MAG: hypothetical protein ACXWUN_04395 [Allosphingosinicella sp.]
MRSFQLFAAAVAATLGLGACTVSADGDHAEADATDKAANSARATDGNEGTTIRIGREGARADIDAARSRSAAAASTSISAAARSRQGFAPTRTARSRSPPTGTESARTIASATVVRDSRQGAELLISIKLVKV